MSYTVHDTTDNDFKGGKLYTEADLQEMLEKAYMTGQTDCGIDPSYSAARSYALQKLRKTDE
jgi:hypothetical protein